jgi:hypothetical protein
MVKNLHEALGRGKCLKIGLEAVNTVGKPDLRAGKFSRRARQDLSRSVYSVGVMEMG